MIQQLDLIELLQKDSLIETRLNHINPLLDKWDRKDIQVIAINKYYEWSFLGKLNGGIYSFHIYEKSGWLDLRKHRFDYTWDDVLDSRLNYIAISN